MPVVRINDATFADLKSIATWFGMKTPSETIERVVKEVMEQLGMERDGEPDEDINVASDGVMQFDSDPGLAFTKPLVATVNGKAVPNPRWSSILLTMIAQVKAKGLEGDELVRELGVSSKAAKFEGEGFRYHADLGISVQGQSASDAWKEVDRIARKWRIPVAVEFCWRQNPRAKYPGRNGVLHSGNR
ncbi:hypothetical protein JVX98_23395 [Ensifer sp. PDNC004]|uniref:T4SS efffector SepA family protein n=1 Tax=Ensifer sp. PDNC004 TaxID=2811423 RepID=UPI00196370F3|nr:hypothetical protein [Ensifer sp. PDNC004]QRY67292.1 hypothetical protein JVX98_23395 [Ensifer sp. PDNC004]